MDHALGSFVKRQLSSSSSSFFFIVIFVGATIAILIVALIFFLSLEGLVSGKRRDGGLVSGLFRLPKLDTPFHEG